MNSYSVEAKAMRNCFFYAITSYVEFRKYGIPEDGKYYEKTGVSETRNYT